MSNWTQCKTIFSNGMEFELFQEQCMSCARYRKHNCRILNRCYEAMFDKNKFPYADLLDATGGYGGKKCKLHSAEIPKRSRVKKETEGQISFV